MLMCFIIHAVMTYGVVELRMAPNIFNLRIRVSSMASFTLRPIYPRGRCLPYVSRRGIGWSCSLSGCECNLVARLETVKVAAVVCGVT